MVCGIIVCERKVNMDIFNKKKLQALRQEVRQLKVALERKPTTIDIVVRLEGSIVRIIDTDDCLHSPIIKSYFMRREDIRSLVNPGGLQYRASITTEIDENWRDYKLYMFREAVKAFSADLRERMELDEEN